MFRLTTFLSFNSKDSFLRDLYIILFQTVITNMLYQVRFNSTCYNYDVKSVISAHVLREQGSACLVSCCTNLQYMFNEYLWNEQA